jgi:hypothetical protein
MSFLEITYVYLRLFSALTISHISPAIHALENIATEYYVICVTETHLDSIIYT